MATFRQIAEEALLISLYVSPVDTGVVSFSDSDGSEEGQVDILGLDSWTDPSLPAGRMPKARLWRVLGFDVEALQKDSGVFIHASLNATKIEGDDSKRLLANEELFLAKVPQNAHIPFVALQWGGSLLEMASVRGFGLPDIKIPDIPIPVPIPVPTLKTEITEAGLKVTDFELRVGEVCFDIEASVKGQILGLPFSITVSCESCIPTTLSRPCGSINCSASTPLGKNLSISGTGCFDEEKGMLCLIDPKIGLDDVGSITLPGEVCLPIPTS